jgi:hypothetical protein
MGNPPLGKRERLVIAHPRCSEGTRNRLIPVEIDVRGRRVEGRVGSLIDYPEEKGRFGISAIEKFYCLIGNPMGTME